jgi:hypothetical protein
MAPLYLVGCHILVTTRFYIINGMETYVPQETCAESYSPRERTENAGQYQQCVEETELRGTRNFSWIPMGL